jgi:hypothetical protein
MSSYVVRQYIIVLLCALSFSLCGSRKIEYLTHFKKLAPIVKTFTSPRSVYSIITTGLKDKNLLWIIFYDYEYNELFCINTRPVKPDNSCHLLRPRSYHKRIFDDFLEGSWRGRYEGIHTDNVRKEVCCTEDSRRKQKAHSVSFSIDKEILKAHVQLPLYTHGSGQGFPLPALTVSRTSQAEYVSCRSLY